MRVGADKLSGQGTVKGQWTSGIMFGANSNHVRRAAPCQHFTPAALKLTPGLEKQFEKQKELFLSNPFHSPLDFKQLTGTNKGFYAFRINDQYL
jgi:hypothetical protein